MSRLLRGLTHGAAASCVMLLVGCGDDGTSHGPAPVIVDESITTLRPLGWLGASVQPLRAHVSFDHDGSMVVPGGVVVRSLDDASPLAAAGVAVGDAIVRVGDEWMPVKDDPSVDVLAAVELELSSGRTQPTLSLWRDGTVREVALTTDRPALEVGLPISVERFQTGAASAIAALDSQRNATGHWTHADPAVELTWTSWAHLAQHAVLGADDEATQASAKRLQELLAHDTIDEPYALASALIAQSEALGPLPDEVLLAAAPSPLARITGGADLPSGAQIFMAGDLPEGFSLDGMDMEGVQIQSISFDTTGDSPGFTMPEGSVRLDAEAMGHVTVADGTEEDATEKPDLRTLLEQHDPERLVALTAIDTLVARLLATQGADGLFGTEGTFEPPVEAAATEEDGTEETGADEESAEEAGNHENPISGAGTGDSDGDDTESEPSWTDVERSAAVARTSHALLALGCAQRVGATLPTIPVEQACKALRRTLHDGKVLAAVARGADRRLMAGESAQVALAFAALGCPDTDDFLRAVLSYSNDKGIQLLEAAHGRPTHLLSTALLRRSRGLASWQSFYDQFRLTLVAAQSPDGTFSGLDSDTPDAVESFASGVAWETALGAVLLAMQDETALPVLCGFAENPFAPTIDGEGVSTAPAPTAAPAGMNEAITDPAEAEAMLKELGIDLNELMEGSIQIEGGPPDDG